MTRISKDGLLYSPGVANGATGITSTTANGLMAGGTTSTGAMQNAGTGTTGQWYKSAGNAALGTWTNQTDLSGKILIGTQNVTNVATIDIVNLVSTISEYQIILSGIVPSTNATNLRILTSSDNGSSWDSGAGAYAWQYTANGDTGTANANGGSTSASSTFIQCSENMSNSASANDYEFKLIGANLNVISTGVSWQGRYVNSSSVYRSTRGTGSRIATTTVNGIQFKFSSGNIASAIVKIYGYVI